MSTLGHIATNSDQLYQTKFVEQQNETATFEWAKAQAENDYENNYLKMNKPLDGTYLNAYDFHIEPTLYYGVTHYTPMPTQVVEYFGLSSGNTVDPFGWLPYQKKYTLCGE
jgi:hypothetical protein